MNLILNGLLVARSGSYSVRMNIATSGELFKHLPGPGSPGDHFGSEMHEKQKNIIMYIVYIPLKASIGCLLTSR